MDNTIHFQRYNSGGFITETWQDSPYFISLRNERRKRSEQMQRARKRNLARRKLQQSILQLLIDVQPRPVSLDDIAAFIGRSRGSTVHFLSKHHDDLWIPYQGDTSRWWTSLPELPDRLFY